MATSTLPTLSFIMILLSLFFFVLPALIGSSVLVFSFLLSFVLLIIAFFTSIAGLNDSNKENLPGLALFSFIISITFLLFLIIGALLQV